MLSMLLIAWKGMVGRQIDKVKLTENSCGLLAWRDSDFPPPLCLLCVQSLEALLLSLLVLAFYDSKS